MSLFKGKKKKTYHKKISNTLKTTIDNRHNKKMLEININIDTLNEKQQLLNKIKDTLKQYQERSMNELLDAEIKVKLNLLEDKRKLEQEIENINKNHTKNNYILETSHLLYEYFNENNIYNSGAETPVTNSTKTTVLDFFKSNNVSKSNNESTPAIKSDFSSKNDIMNEYLKITDMNYVKYINNISTNELDNCMECGISRIRDTIHGCMICPQCGCEEKILIDCDTPSYKEPPRELTYFAYKKINHANEWLSQFQAKESTDISDDIFEKILKELKKETYINLKHLTVERVRDILKKLDLTKYYEHCHYITNRITGKPAPVITGELEDKVRNMFKEIQGPWMKYCPSDRSNFFSYPYIFYKFFQLLDKDDYLPYCRLLKSREKLQEHDEVWKLICADLKWQYIPTV
jgi:hypothetical protein